MSEKRVVVIGAGMGGLAAALDLAARGVPVTVVEQASSPGGKLRQQRVGTVEIDAGPTVLTMRWVFESLFADAGSRLDDALTLHSASLLARHAWTQGGRLDLHADPERTEAEIGALCGAAEARRFRLFRARAREIHDLLKPTFIEAPRPTPVGLMRRMGAKGLADLARIAPFTTLWKTLGDFFHDPRLRQLFARYATYVGSSPFDAPATLMLIAHVEQEGVWLVEGGMSRLAEALADLARQKGADLRFNTAATGLEVRQGRVSGVRLADGSRLEASAVIANTDLASLAAGTLGPEAARAQPGITPADRSLSAVTWALEAEVEGFPLTRHTVFFPPDYAGEFAALTQRRVLPPEPTVYLCAQDRDGAEGPPPCGPERLLILINAPATGDRHPFDDKEIAQCQARTFAVMERCGCRIRPQDPGPRVTTPRDFNTMFPGTGGALYGRSTHGWNASFGRMGSATALPGLWVAGGGVHPGPGIPMAVLSGRLAARAALQALTSCAR
ncbi:1-hydroxycarotenoid 3,4-desaturase CrtD [Pararhodospirillum photometricum]|nr:1-hydroxycarotenoid 3,4-desaturase CrtD [Pararhodospirillum photometricum]